MAETTPVCAFDTPAPDFDLPGTDGRRYRRDAVRGPNGLLVMFICNHCPYVKAVIDKIVRDCSELAPHGIHAIGIMSNDPAYSREDSFDNMKRIAREKGFPFPYVLDDTQAVARAYGAECTPEFFGLDARLELQYHGRLDASGTRALPDAKRELFEAMMQVAQTGRGPQEQTPSIGCSIKWKP